METSKELVFFFFFVLRPIPPSDIQQANILMSNDAPLRACLADFGFMTIAQDPRQPMSCSVQLEGGTVTFMSPELLMPSVFGVKDPVPTLEADIYAFGLVLFQVCEKHGGYLLLAYTIQVLTGEIPFRPIRATELGFYVVQGLRPEKPADAPAIGFSDSLWTFVQRCWNGDRDLRPRVAEVVTNLAKAAANWRGLMPPCIPAETLALSLKKPVSSPAKRCEFRVVGRRFIQSLSYLYTTGGDTTQLPRIEDRSQAHDELSRTRPASYSPAVIPGAGQPRSASNVPAKFANCNDGLIGNIALCRPTHCLAEQLLNGETFRARDAPLYIGAAL